MIVDIITRTVVSLTLAAGVGALQQAPPKPADQKPPAAQSSTGATRVGSIDLTVTSLTGAVLADAKVSAEGPSSRQGSTSPEGEVVLTNITPGTYRCRIQRDGFYTLEKEIVVKAGARTTTEATLSPAPPPPPPPTPAPTPAPRTAAPVLAAGSPVTVSLVDQIADDLIKSKDPIAEHALGCSGATASKLVRLNDALPTQTHADADEIIYLIAGTATLTMNGKDQSVSAGWFSLIPRGMSHALKAKGGKPVLVLSIQSGPACANASAPVEK